MLRVATKVVSVEEYDQKRETLDVAKSTPPRREPISPRNRVVKIDRPKIAFGRLSLRSNSIHSDSAGAFETLPGNELHWSQLYVWTIPERDEIHELIGYDS